MSVEAWAQAFAFTQIVEVPIYRRLLGCSTARAFAASTITHPLVWLVVVELGWRAGWGTRATAAETFAVAIEALWFALPIAGVAHRPRQAMTASFVANATSFVLGLVAYRLASPWR